MCQTLLQYFTPERRRRVKRRLSYCIIVVNFFLGGFEYGVIFPTAMDYLASLGAGGREATLFGLLIVSYAVANIAGGYIGGLWADTIVETRPLLVMAALPQIAGNALYFFAATPGQLVASRALSGAGSGTNTAMLAELTRTTSLRHRTSVISVISFARQLGIVLGPAAGAYLTGMPDVFRHRVTQLNAPGLLLTMCYVVYMVLLTLLYSNLTVDEDEREERPASPGAPSSAAVPSAMSAAATGMAAVVAAAVGAGARAGAAQAHHRPLATTQTRSNTKRVSSAPQEADARAPRRPLFFSFPQPLQRERTSWPPYARLEGRTGSPPPREIRLQLPDGWDGAVEGPEGTEGCPHCPHCRLTPPVCPSARSQLTPPAAPSAPPAIATHKAPPSVLREWRELLCWPIAALFACNFAAYLAQTSLEAVLPALVERDLGLPIEETGRIFIYGGLVQCTVLGVIIATPLLPFLRDQRLIVAGLMIMVAAHTQLLATLVLLRGPHSHAGRVLDDVWFWALLAGSCIQFFGYPFVNAVVTSFLSKLLSRGAQGVGAAGLRLSMCLGLMLGPLWGSGFLRHQVPLVLVPMLALMLSLFGFYWFEHRGGFRARMRAAAVVDTVTPRVCAAPRRVRTISALVKIPEVSAERDGASEHPAGGAESARSTANCK